VGTWWDVGGMAREAQSARWAWERNDFLLLKVGSELLTWKARMRNSLSEKMPWSLWGLLWAM